MKKEKGPESRWNHNIHYSKIDLDKVLVTYYSKARTKRYSIALISMIHVHYLGRERGPEVIVIWELSRKYDF